MIYPLAHGGDSRALPAAALVLNALIVLAAIACPGGGWRSSPRSSRCSRTSSSSPSCGKPTAAACPAYGALSMLPVFWLALYGTRSSSQSASQASPRCSSCRSSSWAAPEYPPSEWTRALLWLCVAPIVGFTVQSLVASCARAPRRTCAARRSSGQPGGDAQARRQHGRRDRGDARACPDGRPQGRPRRSSARPRARSRARASPS